MVHSVALNADRRGTQSGCTTVWFDWQRSGHYDARADRDNGAAASSPSVVEAEGLLDEISSGLSGTSARVDAVFYLERVTFQAMMINCMAGKGFV